MQHELRGSIVPLVTPMTGPQASLDLGALRRLVDFQIEAGSHGVSCTGTTGEPTSLTLDERRSVIETVADHVNGRVPFLAGTGSANTAETIELTRFAESIGADGALVVTPYQVRPTQEGLLEHFTAVASRVDIPVVLYNIPGRSGVNIEPETQLRIRTRCPNVVGIKEANQQFGQVTMDLAVCGEDWLVFSGIELLCYPMLALGGAGHVSATANVAPAALAELHDLVEASKWDEARRLHFRLVELNEALFAETNPAPVKYLLSELDLCEATVRRPLVEPTSETKLRVRRAAEEYGLFGIRTSLGAEA